MAYRKSKNLGGGFRLNVSRKGIGISGGVKGFRVGVGPRGIRTTASIPGTGIYSTKTRSLNAAKGNSRKAATKYNNTFQQATVSYENDKRSMVDDKYNSLVYQICGMIAIIAGVAFLVWMLSINMLDFLSIILSIGMTIMGIMFIRVAAQKREKEKSVLNNDVELISTETKVAVENRQEIKAMPTDGDNLQTTEVVALESAMKEEITFPDWYTTVSFGKSTSQNYPKAVACAKAAPQYHEQINDGKILHQGIYSSKPDDYLAFINLYELVSSWKSSFVFINGKMVDRKIIGKINYCYGDKCRSGNPDFCYGASQFTVNPFGCHRLQISDFNNPWWSFGEVQGGFFKVNKKNIKERIDEYTQIYCNCPSFDYDHILEVLDSLPDRLTKKEYANLKYTIVQEKVISTEATIGLIIKK